MEGKPVHYDGSGQISASYQETAEKEPFKMTDEMRKNIGGNPYIFETNE